MGGDGHAWTDAERKTQTVAVERDRGRFLGAGRSGRVRERELTLAAICRSLRVHVQQVGLGLSAERYETVARHVEALAESAYRGVFRGRHSSRTVDVSSDGEEG